MDFDLKSLIMKSDGIWGQSKKGMIAPKTTLLITEGMAKKHPVMRFLKKAYENSEEMKTKQRIAISVVNAAVSHGRNVLCLTKRTLQAITLSDKNFSTRPTYTGEKYSEYLKQLYDIGFKRLTRAEQRLKKPAIFCIDPEGPLAGLVDTDFDEQLWEALVFARPSRDLVQDQVIFEKFPEAFDDEGNFQKDAQKKDLKKVQKEVREKRKEKKETREEFDLSGMFAPATDDDFPWKVFSKSEEPNETIH